jgi:hypothetical protein
MSFAFVNKDVLMLFADGQNCTWSGLAAKFMHVFCHTSRWLVG